MKNTYQSTGSNSSCADSEFTLLPRERMHRQGPGNVSDLELLAVMLGSGTRSVPVMHLARIVLERLDLHGPGIGAPALEGIPGLGPVKRQQILASLELFRRLHLPGKSRISRPGDVMPLIQRWADRDQEHFIALSLNGASELIRVRLISIGILNRTLVHPREVFAQAISDKAASILVAHNHPSGNVEPSREDIEVTRRLKQAGTILGIPLVDHVIFSAENWVSLSEKGML